MFFKWKRPYGTPMAQDAVSRRLIVLEGIDGSGKSTVAHALAETLAERGLSVLSSREPTGGPAGRAVREALKDPEHDPLAEALLFCADHAAHVRWIEARLAEGHTVVSDRYSGSCLAYQGATLEENWPDGAEVTPMYWLETVLAPYEREPDLVILLDLPPALALERIGDRTALEKFEQTGLLERVRRNYLSLAAVRGWTVVDGAQPPEAILAACLEAVEALVEGPS